MQFVVRDLKVVPQGVDVLVNPEGEVLLVEVDGVDTISLYVEEGAAEARRKLLEAEGAITDAQVMRAVMMEGSSDGAFWVGYVAARADDTPGVFHAQDKAARLFKTPEDVQAHIEQYKLPAVPVAVSIVDRGSVAFSTTATVH